MAIGTLAVDNLVAPLVDPSPIGGYRAEFFTDDGAVIGSIEDVNGVFDLAGSLTISADRNYQFIGKVAATDSTTERSTSTNSCNRGKYSAQRASTPA